MQPARKKIVIIGATSAIAEHCARQWLAQTAAYLLLVNGVSPALFAKAFAAHLERAGRGVLAQWALIMTVIRHLPRTIFNRMDI